MVKSMSYEEQILEELRKISGALIKPEELKEPEEEPKKDLRFKRLRLFKDDFVNFLKTYKIVGLAVAFIMGLYMKEVIDAFVNDLIMPILQFIPGIDDWTKFNVGPFMIGHFIGVLLTFIIIAFIIYWIIKLSKRLKLE